jgi:glucokinase
MPPPRVLAFDAGGTKLLGGVVGADGEIERRVLRGIAGLTRDALLETICEAAEKLREGAPHVLAAGFGIPSTIDRRSGRSVQSVHLPFDDFAFGAEIEDRLGLPVAWDNDANAALFGELRLGAARGASEVVMLTVGTGIGGALAFGGRIYRGSSGAAGELGHIPVDSDGPPCQGGCPGRGCLEALASGAAIGREGATVASAAPDSALGRAVADGREASGVLVTELALEGDPGAMSVLELAGERLGAGLAGIANALDPEVIIVGGGAMRAGELLLGPARRVLAERALRPASERVRVTAAELGEVAGMVGAGLAAHELARGGERAEAWR